jgi:hypothetical protein
VRSTTAATSASLITSSRSAVIRACAVPSCASAASSMSVANTSAPASAMATAEARPMPAPAAVTSAVFPARENIVSMNAILRMVVGHSARAAAGSREVVRP